MASGSRPGNTARRQPRRSGRSGRLDGGQVIRAVDTNILVYAHRADSIHHEAARTLVQNLAEGVTPWAIPWPCVYEFLRVVTHPRVFHPPTRPEEVLTDLESLLASPSLRCLGETRNHTAMLGRVLAEAPVIGNLLYDAHIAALLLEHGVSELYTADADFKRFGGFRVTNPFHLG